MPPTQGRETEWRQGLVLQHQAASALGLTCAEDPDSTVVVVISHDCDIANHAESEPMVEVIVGKRIASLGADSNAKTARRLHVEFQTDEGAVAVELVAVHKVSVEKHRLLSTTPRAGWALAPEGLATLQIWLAARYRRAAFADEFERRLKDKPARLDKKIAKALVAPSRHIVAVFFDVDEGLEKHRVGLADAYQLRMTLLYDGTQDEPVAYEAAQTAADTIQHAFEAAFFRDDAWQSVQLLSCTPVSDSVMTVAESRLLKQWRLDHLSLDDDPQQPLLDQP